MEMNETSYYDSISRIASEIDVHGGTILVTGATGLIGTSLIDVLNEANRSYKKHFDIIALGRDKMKLEDRFGDF